MSRKKKDAPEERMAMHTTELKQLLDEWSKRPAFRGKSFDETFTVEGIPAWYFVKTLTYPEMFPKTISPYIPDISIISAARKRLLRGAVARAIRIREKRKNASGRNEGSRPGRKILLLSYTNHILESGEIFRFQNIIDEIRKEEGRTGIAALPLFADPISSYGVGKLQGQHTIYDYHTADSEAKAEREAKRLHDAIWEEGEGPLKAALGKDSVKFWGQLGPAFRFVFSESILFVAILYYLMFRKALRDEDVRVSITSGAESLFERSLSAASYAEKRPIVMLEHGLGSIPSHKPEHLEYFTNYFAMGEYDKKRLDALGFPEDFVRIPGPVIFDEIVKYKGTAGNNARKKVFLATSPFPESGLMDKETYFDHVRRIFNEMKRIGVGGVVKLHPREKHMSEYKKICKSIGFEDCEFHQHISRDRFFRMIAECDSFVHFGSTASLEAMILDKPIVEIRLAKIDNNVVQGSDVSISIGPEEDIGGAIEESFLDEEKYKSRRETLIRKYFDTIDGKAGMRAARMLIGIAGERLPAVFPLAGGAPKKMDPLG